MFDGGVRDRAAVSARAVVQAAKLAGSDGICWGRPHPLQPYRLLTRGPTCYAINRTSTCATFQRCSSWFVNLLRRKGRVTLLVRRVLSAGDDESRFAIKLNTSA